MYQALRQAARRASPSSSGVIPPYLVHSSALVVAAVLVALATDRRKENGRNVDLASNSSSSSRRSAIASQLPFILPTSSSSICQCELSTKISRLRRSMTSKLMAAEATDKTFFSLYEVDFDHPLGQGAYGDVYLCRDNRTGEECALKKIPKVCISIKKSSLTAVFHIFPPRSLLMLSFSSGVHRTRGISTRNECSLTNQSSRRPPQHLYAA